MSAALLLPLLAVLSAPAARTDAPVLRLKAEAATPGARIQLQDLIEPPAAPLPAVLLEIDLGRSPSQDFERLITRDAVAALLPEGAPPLAGAAESRVRTEFVEVSKERLLAEARAFVAREGGLAPGARLEVSRAPFAVRVPRGRQGIELAQRFRAGGTVRGPLTVLTEVQVDGALQVVVPASFVARTFATVPLLAVDLARGEALAAGHLRFVETETTHMAVAPATRHEALLGQVSRRHLKAGEPLAARDFEPAVLVKRNDAVNLVFARGALRAETLGLARDSGTLGSAIRVENLLTRKQLVGRVAGPGLVELNP